MSYTKLIIDADDKAKFDSLVDGSQIATTVHGHRATSRTVTSSESIAVSDENNIIDVEMTRTGAILLDTSLIDAIPNFQFKVRVGYNATYDVYVEFSGTVNWILNGITTGSGDIAITYAFSIDNSGLCIPDNDGLSLYSPS
jgi:hypothetical protein